MQFIKMIKLTKIIFPMPSLISATFRVVFGTSSNVFSLTSIVGLQSQHIPLQPVSIKHGLRTADYGLRTGYKIRTRYKTRTGKYGLGIKHGLGIKRGLENTDWV